MTAVASETGLDMVRATGKGDRLESFAAPRPSTAERREIGKA